MLNSTKPAAQAVTLTLLLAVLFGSLLACGCSPSPKISVESDPRVFTLFAGLAAVGYGEGQADPASETLRAQLEVALAGWTADDLYPMSWLEQNYRPDELVSATLQLGPPPDFAIELESLTGLRAFLARLWLEVAPLYGSNRGADVQALEPMADPAAAVIQGAIDYAGGGYPCKTWRVVPESLVLPGCPYSYRTGGTAWIGVSRAWDSWRSGLAREAFRVLIHDGLAQLDTEGALERFQPLLERVRFDGDLPAYLEENLAWALTARTLDASDTEAVLDEATRQGFVLARRLCDKLGDYEASGRLLRSYLSELLGSVDIERVLASTPPSWTKFEWSGSVRICQGWILRVNTEATISFPVVGGVEINFPLGEGSETSVSLGIMAGGEGGTEWDVLWSQSWAVTEEPAKITPSTREPGKLTLSGTGLIWAFLSYKYEAPDPPPWQITLTLTESGE